MGNYNLSPFTEISGFDTDAFSGYSQILNEVQGQIRKKQNKKVVVVCEFYPGVNRAEVLEGLIGRLDPELTIDSESCALPEEQLNGLLEHELRKDDRVFGIMTQKQLRDFFDEEKIKRAGNTLDQLEKGTAVVFGMGASLIAKGDLVLYFDMERWEIQKRYRDGLSNWHCSNHDAPVLSKYKRGFFIEWRAADRHKKGLYPQIDYFVDTGTAGEPNMVTAKAFFAGLAQVSKTPFRTVPYFDPGVWGGQWMKETFGLDETQSNFAWSFDGVPEENTLQMKFGAVVFKTPCMNLVFAHPHELLGEHVHARFGTEFPIRFDLLDTMGGGNLSLQVHPLTEYIQEQFHMHYTQDESYYILDAGEDACVYIGLRDNVDKEAMIEDLYRAQRGEIEFPAEKYINRFPVKKHDHILIPAGTIHCSGKNTMVLEISATPYIFTFKLWDWNRLGLDGLPRPTHIEHGIPNIQWDRTTGWVEENLLHRETVVQEDEKALVERTGLHEREFIDVFRHTFTSAQTVQTHDSVNVLNLVEGSEVIVRSPENQFPDMAVHYAETFIVPASAGTYRLISADTSCQEVIKVVQAVVRR